MTSGGRRFSGRFDWAGYALGFGLGGFFEGILCIRCCNDTNC